MNKKSFAILNLMAFSSLVCLSSTVMAATKSGAAPALQISDELWSPPSPPAETPSTAQAPALEVSDELWQPQQNTAAPVKTPVSEKAPVSEKTAVPPPALYVPGSEPAESQPAPLKQSLPPVQQAQTNIQLEKAGTVSEPPQASEDLPKTQAQQSSIESTPIQAVEPVQASAAPVAPPAKFVEAKPAAAQANAAPATPPADTQVLKTLQGQVDALAKDNAELQQKLKTSASASPAPVSVPSHSTVIASSDPTDKVRITKSEPEQMHVIKFNMKDDDDRLAGLEPASGGPIDSATLPGKNDPAPAVVKVDIEDRTAPVKTSLKDEQPAPLKAKTASGGTWQEESVDASEPAQVGELDKLKKRYEMSEAENARLGGMVKNEKDQCELDKGKMQKLLFDAQPSDEQQRYITDLERKLGESQQALAEQKRTYDLQIRLLKSRLAKRSDS